MQCDLCKQEMGGGAPRSIAGVAVCAACNAETYLPGRLMGRGLHQGIVCRAKDGSLVADLKEVELLQEYTISSLAECPHPSGIHARLQYEGFTAKLVKIFEHEIQIGDKQFDDMVWIRTNTKDEARAFLSLSKVQGVIMEIISMKGEIDIDDAKVYVKAEANPQLIPKEFVLHTAVLLHLLAGFSSP